MYRTNRIILLTGIGVCRSLRIELGSREKFYRHAKEHE
jgi:hypothetical protein